MVRTGTEEIISTRLDDRLSFEDEAETESRHLILEVQYTDQQHLHHLGGLLKMQNLRLRLRLLIQNLHFKQIPVDSCPQN